MGEVGVEFHKGVEFLSIDVIFVEIVVWQDNSLGRAVGGDVGDPVAVSVKNLCSGEVAVDFSAFHRLGVEVECIDGCALVVGFFVVEASGNQPVDTSQPIPVD